MGMTWMLLGNALMKGKGLVHMQLYSDTLFAPMIISVWYCCFQIPMNVRWAMEGVGRLAPTLMAAMSALVELAGSSTLSTMDAMVI